MQTRFTTIAPGIEHPAPHRKGTTGDLVQFADTGIYMLKVGGRFIPVPQDWAAKVSNKPK